jgi:hypothetical protein
LLNFNLLLLLLLFNKKQKLMHKYILFLFFWFNALHKVLNSKRHHVEIMTDEGKNSTSQRGLSCDDYPCPEARGICNIENTCSCFRGYMTNTNFAKYGSYQCNYQKKSQMVAFLLEFILSFGSGHFYLGNYVMGISKFFFCAASMFLFCFLPYLTAQHKTMNINKLVPYFQCLTIILFCIWQIIDSILFGMNYYNDSNGIKPSDW